MHSTSVCVCVVCVCVCACVRVHLPSDFIFSPILFLESLNKENLHNNHYHFAIYHHYHYKIQQLISQLAFLQAMPCSILCMHSLRTLCEQFLCHTGVSTDFHVCCYSTHRFSSVLLFNTQIFMCVVI